MRIIAGALKGRIYEGPTGHRTHPMGDKVKGALFNALGDVTRLTVLDAFAGSGALSFEAISRGAKSAVAIDLDLDAYKNISHNVDKLGLREQIMVLRKNVNGWARNNQHQQFDIVIADPPYDDIRPTLLQRLVVLTKSGGIFILSWPRGEETRAFEGVDLLMAKQYAGAQLVFYRKK